jgi:hypothetical protein
MIDLLRAVLEDFAQVLDRQLAAAREAVELSDSDISWSRVADAYQRLHHSLSSDRAKEDFGAMLTGVATGLMHSICYGLDAGAGSRTTGRLYLVDEEGNLLANGLDEDFLQHLHDTGRPS